MADNVRIYDVSGPSPVEGSIPADQLEQALSTGRFSLPAGEQMPVISPEGELGHVPAEQAAHALQNGYRYATPDLQKEMKYGTPGQMALTGVEGAAEALTGGASGAVERLIGQGEEARARQEANPGSHMAGEVGGFLAGLALTKKVGIPTAPAAITRLGEAAEGAVAGSRVAGLVARGATEGAAIAGSHALNEAMLGDPNLTAESVVAEVGLGAALGGGLGLALTPIASGLKKGFGLLRRVQPATEASSLADVAGSLPNGEEVLQGLTKQKPHANEIRAAAEEIGAPVLEMQLSDSPAVQKAHQAVVESPTVFGVAEQQKVRQGFDAASTAVKDTLQSEGAPASKMATGEALRDSLAAKAEAQYQPVRDLYNQIKEVHGDVTLNKRDLSDAANQLWDIEGVRVKRSSPQYRFIEETAGEIQDLKSVDQLRQYMKAMKEAAGTDYSLKRVLGAARDVLEELEARSISDGAKRLGIDPAEVMAKSEQARAGYRSLIDTFKELGGKLGKSRFYGPQDFLNHLSDMNGEKVVERLFSKKDARFLGFLKERFPEEAKLLADYQRGDIASKAIEDGFLSPKKALGAIDKLEPEVKDFLFTKEQLKKLEAASTYVDAFPPNFNPSKTAVATQWMEALRHPISTATAHLADAAKLKAVRALSPVEAEAAEQLLHIRAMANKTLRAIDAGANAIMAGTGEVPAKVLPRRLPSPPTVATNDQRDGSTAKRDPDSARMLELASNPAAMVERMGSATAQLQAHAPETANAITQTVTRAASFLASKAPPHNKPGPLEPSLPVSADALARYDRYSQVVHSPLSALALTARGQLLPQDVEALQAVHPRLLQHMKDKVLEKMTNHAANPKADSIPYAIRQSVSLLMGAPVDSTLTPQARQALQAVQAPKQAPQGPPQGQQAPPKRSTASLGHLAASSATPGQAREQSRASRWK